MKSKSNTENSPADTIKLVAALVILGAGIFGFYVYEDQPQLFRVLGILAVGAVAVGIAVTTNPGANLWRFMQDSRTEVRKVVWPTRQETVQTTIIVLIVVVLVAIFLWLMDMFFLWGVQQLLNPGG
ncbi:preprotein translocase subunit SecE [Aquisalimonas asiatica]|uniref:Protein translocase subunit SecE n=1 Tax=Aquisalimonas asiatica TaxID=406100 RepID=A0A1H8VWI1_9GAMM|nr:preprotein translocase subunit SecE [Aquisalimonas asiatica]SEP19684.1 protein translocase subunit secE/sec61 gamma [Aquisalimonas asiatica]